MVTAGRSGVRSAPQHGVTLREATKVWAYIGFNSFGGPAGQIAVMHRELVERRHWVSEKRFLHALNYCMILPGPEAQQLATYIGWLMHGNVGAVIAGSLFVIPGFIAMLFLAVTYALFGGVTWVSGLLFGLQAAVVALVVEAVVRIGRRTLRAPALMLVAGFSFAAIAFAQTPFPIVVVAAGLTGWLLGRRRPHWFPLGKQGDVGDERGSALLSDDETIPRGVARSALRAALVCAALWLVPTAALIIARGMADVFAQEALLFSKSAVVTFGGAYAVLGYIAHEAVNRYGWISPKDMITGLGLAETTPGPLIMVVQFVGFLAAYNRPEGLSPLTAGTVGAVLTAWVTFIPCFLLIFLGAPYVERLRHNRTVSQALTSVGAAVAGVVVNLALWFFLHTAFGTVHARRLGPLVLPVPDRTTINLASLGISVVAAVLVLHVRMGTLKVLGICATAGVVLTLTGLTA